jgi:hypothetical protein
MAAAILGPVISVGTRIDIVEGAAENAAIDESTRTIIGPGQVRASHQSQDRQGARPGSASAPSAASRRGDRMKRRELSASKKAPSNGHFLN